MQHPSNISNPIPQKSNSPINRFLRLNVYSFKYLKLIMSNLSNKSLITINIRRLLPENSSNANSFEVSVTKNVRRSILKNLVSRRIVHHSRFGRSLPRLKIHNRKLSSLISRNLSHYFLIKLTILRKNLDGNLNSNIKIHSTSRSNRSSQ